MLLFMNDRVKNRSLYFLLNACLLSSRHLLYWYWQHIHTLAQEQFTPYRYIWL